MDGAHEYVSVPEGPSIDPAVKGLAVQTEDHPIEYGSFEGRIPDGEYGAGDSLIWGNGAADSIPPGQLSEQRKKGRIHVEFKGKKLRGAWHLVRTRVAGQRRESENAPGKAQWLFFKAKDGKENPAYDVVAERPESVVSGRVQTRGPERAGKLRTSRAAPEEILKAYFPPMLATLVDQAPPGAWHAEVKYDGYRALSALSNRRVAMWSRNMLHLIGPFPHIARALAATTIRHPALHAQTCVLPPHALPRLHPT